MKSKNKIRLDDLLVEREVSKNLDQARKNIWSGKVKLLNTDYKVLAPHIIVDSNCKLEIVSPKKFVSRGGYKLDHAINDFNIDVSGMTVLDIGASTGGFTDCLLQKGAKIVYAVDVGKGQLNWKLRKNPKVIPVEGLNARYKFNLSEHSNVDFIVIDVSFISAKLIIENCINLLKRKGYLLVLIKPQFEAEKHEVGIGGVILEPEIHARVVGEFLHWALKKGLNICGLKKSKILGLKGNQEFFVYLKDQ